MPLQQMPGLRVANPAPAVKSLRDQTTSVASYLSNRFSHASTASSIRFGRKPRANPTAALQRTISGFQYAYFFPLRPVDLTSRSAKSAFVQYFIFRVLAS
jgi:hypothetical protein